MKEKESFMRSEPSKAKVQRIVKKAEKYPEQMTQEEWYVLYRVVAITEEMKKLIEKAEKEK